MCKGLELETFKTPAEIVEASLPGLRCGVISGPTFAGEVAAGQPTAVVLALPEEIKNPASYQTSLSNRSLRCYLSTDVRGTELGGTLKNIYAIGSGLCDGLKLGDNAKAAYLTRSLNEMVALGAALGAEKGNILWIERVWRSDRDMQRRMEPKPQLRPANRRRRNARGDPQRPEDSRRRIPCDGMSAANVPRSGD